MATITSNMVTSSPSTEPGLAKQLIIPNVEAKTPKTRRRTSPSKIPSTSREIVYDTSKQIFIPGIGDDDDDSVTEEQAQTYGRIEGNVGNVASTYRRKLFNDTQYGIRKDCELLMIGDSAVVIDTDDNFTIEGTVLRGTEGLWELLMRKSVNSLFISKDDLKTCEKFC